MVLIKLGVFWSLVLAISFFMLDHLFYSNSKAFDSISHVTLKVVLFLSQELCDRAFVILLEN